MPRFPSTSGGNDRRLQAQILREAGGPLGPVTVTPGNGSIDFVDASGNTLFSAAPEGARVRYRGSTRWMTPLLEEQGDTLDAHSGRLTSYGNAITNLGTRVGSAESDIAAHGARLTSYGSAITGLGSRMGSVESKNSSQDSAISSARSLAQKALDAANAAGASAGSVGSSADAALAAAMHAAKQIEQLWKEINLLKSRLQK